MSFRIDSLRFKGEPVPELLLLPKFEEVRLRLLVILGEERCPEAEFFWLSIVSFRSSPAATCDGGANVDYF